jgi:hypothetical protein
MQLGHSVVSVAESLILKIENSVTSSDTSTRGLLTRFGYATGALSLFYCRVFDT